MEKEFVTYEQALALEELGFDEPVINVYDLKSKELVLDEDDEMIWAPVLHNNGATISAPLYQQAFRWFREKYKLISFIGCDEKFFFSITDIPYKDKYYSSHDGLEHNAFYETYEETEQACLDKLIEITKNK